jgi:DNA invertase Pin-like site-specific DNA recombinase
MLYGYARVSSAGQSLEVQAAKLKAAGCEVIRAEKVSGTSTEGREELATLLTFLRAGDELVVTKIDRLARSAADLFKIVGDLSRRGVHLIATDQAAINTTTSEGKLLLGMLAVIAEFETNLRRDRQADGIAKARAQGVYNGRPPKIDVAAIRRLKDEGKGPTAIAKELGIGVASVHRLLKPKAPIAVAGTPAE